MCVCVRERERERERDRERERGRARERESAERCCQKTFLPLRWPVVGVVMSLSTAGRDLRESGSVLGALHDHTYRFDTWELLEGR